MPASSHVKAITYHPKERAVQLGTVRQTIRLPGTRQVKTGDQLLLHGWTGRPYHSPWSWRKKVKVIEVTRIIVSPSGYNIAATDRFVPWRYPEADELALKDGIIPPTGIELGKLLASMHSIREDVSMDIIRWEAVP